MKTKFTKIFLLTLTLAMVIGMAIGFTASAEGEPAAESVAIVSQKIDYAGTTHLYFAVKYENVENPEKIALNVSYVDSEGNAKEVTITESEAVTLKDSAGNDVACRAFMTPGVDAKSFTHKFVAQAVTEAGTESAEKTYSVTEYCYQWLTYIATKAEPTAYELKVKAACEATLAYGTKIQAFLDYYPADNVNDYPENYVYVKGTDGVKVNGADAACVIKGSEVALTYAGTETRLGWEVADLAGTEITVTDDKFTATAHCIAGPELSDAKGKYFLSGLSGLRHDYDVRTTLPDIENFGVKDSEGNVISNTGSFEIVDGALHFEDGDAENAQMVAKFWQGYPSSYNVTVFEFDFKFNQSYGTSPLEFKVSGNSCILYQTQAYDSSYGTGFKLCAKIGSTYIPTGIDYGTWGNIRLEHYFAEDVMKIFVNNVYLGEIAATSNSQTSPLIYLTANERKTGSNADLYVDNVFVGHFTAEEIPYVAGDPDATPAE